MKKLLISLIVVIGILTSFATLSVVSAQEEGIPSWIKKTASFWVNDDVTDSEFMVTIQWLIDNEILQVKEKQDNEVPYMASPESQRDAYKEQLDSLQIKHAELESKVAELEEENRILRGESSQSEESAQCSGSARCFSGIVTEINDGDTIHVDGISIRFAMINSPEYGDAEFWDAKEIVESNCPLGSTALIDEDDGQTEGSHGRIIAVVYCNGVNLNEEALDSGYSQLYNQFCSASEFSSHAWAKRHGC